MTQMNMVRNIGIWSALGISAVVVLAHGCTKAVDPAGAVLTAEDARRALIAYLETADEVDGPGTLLGVTKTRSRLRDEVRDGELEQTDDGYRIAGFHISLEGQWYAIGMGGRGHVEQYRGEFVFEGGRWQASRPKLREIACFKDKDG
jgi:hypothetical protein